MYNITHTDFLELKAKMPNLSSGNDAICGASELCTTYGILLHDFIDLCNKKDDYDLYRSESDACGYEVPPFCVYAGLKDNYDQQRKEELRWRIENDPTW